MASSFEIPSDEASSYPVSDYLKDAIATGRRAAAIFGLPFRNAERGGIVGNWAGAGIGASVDFQDHREYQLGDDPRHINWAAYARTGAYTMKLYREEISPRVDVVFDASPSMFIDEAKARRAWELLAFIMASVERSSAQARFYFINGAGVTEVKRQLLSVGRTPVIDEQITGAPEFRRVNWRPNSMRVIITDLLFAESPETIMSGVISSGRAVVLCPFSKAEVDPPWNGNLKLEECDGDDRLEAFFDEGTLLRYRKSYQRHFAGWQGFCKRYQVAFARVSADDDFITVLGNEALVAGAVSLCN